MKKAFLFLMAAGALMMASCTKDVVSTPETTAGIKLNLNIGGPGADTKVAKKAWAAGDKLNIWFDTLAGEQTEPDLIITFNGTEWTAGALRAGCTPNASGKIMFLYEGYNDVSSTRYNYQWHMSREWFIPKVCSVNYDSYCRPLVFFASNLAYTFSANTLTASIAAGDWRFQTMFKVLIKTHTLMDKTPDYYELQVHNITADEYAASSGAWIIIPESTYTSVGQGSSNYDGKTGGVQEDDGIAFYYSSFTATDANITFTLKEYGGATKTYSVSGKTIAAKNADRCVGVALNYGSFVAAP